MKLTTALFPFLLLLSGSAFSAEIAASYTVQFVEDGDTLLVDINGESQRVQLLGIDAPENTLNPKLTLDIEKTELSKDQLLPLGEAAAQHLQGLVPIGSKVSFNADLTKKDRYGRLPAIVMSADGRSLTEAMVQDGYAIPLEQKEQDDEAYMRRLDRLERFSRKSQNGLWGSHAEIVHKWYDRTH